MYVIQNPFEDQTLHSTLYLKKLNLLSYWKLSCLLPFLLKALLPSFILTEGSLAFFHSYWRLSCLLPFLLKALLPSFILTEGSLAFFHFLLCPEWVCVCVCDWWGSHRVSQTCFSGSISWMWCLIIHIWGSAFLFPICIRSQCTQIRHL